MTLSVLEADSLRVARHALKVVLTFALLDRRRLPLSGMADYVGRVGIYRDFNARFLGLSPAAMAQWLVGDLERAGVVHRDDGWLKPGR